MQQLPEQFLVKRQPDHGNFQQYRVNHPGFLVDKKPFKGITKQLVYPGFRNYRNVGNLYPYISFQSPK